MNCGGAGEWVSNLGNSWDENCLLCEMIPMSVIAGPRAEPDLQGASLYRRTANY